MNGSHVHRLSKSKIAAFEHCAKRLWLQVHERKSGRFEEATLQRFAFGHRIGEIARDQVAGGILIDTGTDMPAALSETAMLVASDDPRPLFEATFQSDDVLVRVDLLLPLASGGWHAVEVKAAGRVNASHLRDLATQVWVMRRCGLRIDRSTIRHLQGPVRFILPVRQAEVTFSDADVTQQIDRLCQSRDAIVARAHGCAASIEPAISPGPHCIRPFTCEFQDRCRLQQEAPLLHLVRAAEVQAVDGGVVEPSK